MSNHTQVTINGWIGGDVALREVSGGRHVATFRVATTSHRYRDGQWQQGTTTWHTVKAWNRLARNAAASLCSGDPVVVHGTFTADSWTREDGTAMTSHAVVARAIGHDLSHGTTTFRRAEATEADSGPRAEAA